MSDPLADVPRETIERLRLFQQLLIDANAGQNLVSRATIDGLWERHIIDSAQLVRLGQHGSWVDIGSGAGLPGIVIACLTGSPVTLVEPRRLRCDFLRHAIAELRLANARVECAKAERVTGRFDNITARAVAPLGRLLPMAAHLSHNGTRWVLPKGKSAKSELAEARHSWQCEAREAASLTDPGASILLLTNVEAKRRP